MTSLPIDRPAAAATPASASAPARNEWRAVVSRYQQSDVGRSIMQMVTTLVPLAAMFFVMYQSLALPYWTTLLLALPTAGLLVRTFIIMHDCSHGSFTPSRRANDLIGWITGVLTLTAYSQWRHSHALHHASSGDLDRRGHGDVDTLTVSEYLAMPRWGRIKYRIVRNPFILFGIGPIHFMIDNRIPPKGNRLTGREATSVWSTNLGIAAIVAALSLWIGFKAVFLVYFPAMYIAAAAGIWLFYVQHQFEGTYWKDHGEWDYATAAIRGSSYFKLPAVLQWFTGNIGLHHIHHLGPRIPNYKLQRCHEENPMFHEVTVLTIGESFRTLRLSLWDESSEQLIGFRDLKRVSQPA
jgi:acyl-lipid omega-6 desaturase (Delta-12 desaturase)